MPQATPDHFILTTPVNDNSQSHSSSAKAAQQPIMKRAGDVVLGDSVLVLAGPQHQQLVAAVVAGSRLVVSTGLYAPLTRGGTIVVDGVVASVHR